MPPVHSYTIDEDDEGEICPVCDGECTCTPLPSNPLSMAELSLKYAIPSSGHSYPPSTPTPTPPLKIKLSIPPSMLASRRLQSTSKLSKSAEETTLDSVNAGYTTLPKKRGRPPKAFASPPNQKKTLLVSNAKRPALKARAAIVKKAVAAKNKKRRRVAISEEDSSSSEALSDVGMESAVQPDPYDSLQFPTFLSASALSSNDSDSDSSSSLSDFSDSSIEAEEENFILADLNNNKKSRVKRELLQGGDDKKRTNHNNDWIIRPRKKSEGPSDVEMNDVDSDATEEQDGAEQDDEEDADATEEEIAMTLNEELDEDEATTDDHRRRYVGHATGWSEEEDESSFDADLFFANLSGSDSIDSDSDDDDNGTSSPPRHHKHPSLSMAEDGDQSDISGSGMLSECTESGWAGRRRAELESLPFEVTEGWDGQIMFTNGVGDGQGLVDIEFEADAERFVALPRKPRRQRGQLIGIHMEENDDDGMEGSDVDMSDGGYEEEDGGEGGEGDTTDEELVGEDELPNERAMALFSLPLSVSAINPLSTVSSPTLPASRRGLGKRMWGMESPTPADILAGRAMFWDSDDELSPRSGSDDASRDDSARRSSLPLGPRKGVFSPSMETRQAVIGEDRKGAEVPSPHPRFNRGRGRTNVGRFSAVEHLLRRHLLTNIPANHQASSPVLGVSSSSVQEESGSPSIQQLLLSSVAATATTSAEDNKTTSTPALQSIELDDVLEASFLHDPEGRDATDDGANNTILPSSDNESGGVRNLSRWDLISVGAFRQTRESWEGARHHPHHHHHTPGSTADYGSVMKSSPMASMLWQQNGGGASGSGNGRPASAPSTVKGKGHGYGKLAKRRQLMMSASTMSSPLILPLSSSSLGGDRTPVALQPAASITSTPTTKSDGDDLKKLLHQQQQQQQHQKSRKEQRRERKSMKKKSSYGGPVHQIHAHHHGHHSHHHHPNSKSRSASSTQRSNFFAMGVPPLNL